MRRFLSAVALSLVLELHAWLARFSHHFPSGYDQAMEWRDRRWIKRMRRLKARRSCSTGGCR
jgi:hypothetical protein